MRKLVILDFNTSKLHIYNIETEITNDYIEEILGHHNASWLTGDIDIFEHKGILK